MDNETSIKLTILPLSQIKPHEKTNPDLLSEVLNGLKETGIQKDPILIDSRSYVILDGMHRRTALQEIGAKFAVCALYNYTDEKIELRRWLRCVLNENAKTYRLLDGLYNLAESSPELAIMKIDRSESGFAVLTQENGFFSTRNFQLLDIYDRLAEFDELSKKEGISIKFIKDSEIDNCLRNSFTVLLPKELTKSDVIMISKSGKTLPYKTTRHIVPYRPLNIAYPLNALKELDLRANLDLLKKTIASSSPRVFVKGSTYNNRVFEEKIVLFN